jgi:hypothetical protein
MQGYIFSIEEVVLEMYGHQGSIKASTHHLSHDSDRHFLSVLTLLYISTNVPFLRWINLPSSSSELSLVFLPIFDSSSSRFLVLLYFDMSYMLKLPTLSYLVLIHRL